MDDALVWIGVYGVEDYHSTIWTIVICIDPLHMSGRGQSISIGVFEWKMVMQTNALKLRVEELLS
jgi:hypothetical protein